MQLERNPFCCFGFHASRNDFKNFEATFSSIPPGSSIVATPRNVLRTKVVTRAPAASRRRNTKRKASKTRALELAQKKEAVDVPREQRDQDEHDAV